jgi:hypothetical protein
MKTPPFFIVKTKGKNKWKLISPKDIDKELSKKSKIETGAEIIPKLTDFSLADRKKLKKYYEENKEPVEGGKLAVSELQGLLEASYDPSISNVNDFELDRSISSKTSKVYYNSKTGQAVVAHMGTQGVLDWGNNAIYAVGGDWAYKKTRRYKEAKRVQEAAEAKYGAKNVSTIGHSQGGLQAELLGKNSKEIITLNKATRPFGNKKAETQTDIRTTGDIVSKFNPFQKKNEKEIVIKSQSYNPLKEHSIDTLTGLEGAQMVGEGIDFEDMKWGSFTEQFDRYKEEHPDTDVKDLEDFANLITKNPTNFKPRTFKRALFYLNVILKKNKISTDNIMSGKRKDTSFEKARKKSRIEKEFEALAKQEEALKQLKKEEERAHRKKMDEAVKNWGTRAMRLARGQAEGGDTEEDEPMEGGAMSMLITRKPLGSDPRTWSPRPAIVSGKNHTTLMPFRMRAPMSEPMTMQGEGFFDDIGDAFSHTFSKEGGRTIREGLQGTFDPRQNSVGDFFKNIFTPDLGRLIARPLIHEGIPAVAGFLGSTIGGIGGPLAGFAAGQAAKYGGKELADYVGKQTGLGLGAGVKKGRYAKGSQEAKDYMASLRAKKTKGGAIWKGATDPAFLENYKREKAKMEKTM